MVKLSRWQLDGAIPNVGKMVLCVAPHTSNWDFIIGKLFYSSLGLKVSFLIKEWWLRPPLLGSWMRRRGGIGVNRKGQHSMTDQLAELFKRSSSLHLAITPEGTRRRNSNWKLGFYYIALKAGVPICPVAIDYKQKQVHIFPLLTPSGNAEQDLALIKSYYHAHQALHPKLFAK